MYRHNWIELLLSTDLLGEKRSRETVELQVLSTCVLRLIRVKPIEIIWEWIYLEIYGAESLLVFEIICISYSPQNWVLRVRRKILGDSCWKSLLCWFFLKSSDILLAGYSKKRFKLFVSTKLLRKKDTIETIQ